MNDPRAHWPGILRARPDLRDALLAAYAEPHRSYHSTRHLAEVLEHVDLLLTETPEVAEVAGSRDAVLLAAWYHDAVYDGSRDDEERSAALAESTLTEAAVPAPLVAEVARLVRLTADHRPGDADLAGQVLCDADLAILGSDPDRYDEYAADVRTEYAHLDEPTFRDGRARVLRSLLEKPALFHTTRGRALWEEAARRNVERELNPPGSP